MALTHHTLSGRALLFAMLAVSSLHRSGLHEQTMQFKTAALRALSASAADTTAGPIGATHHVATCMLLCAFEIMLPSESSGDWLWYIRAAMDTVGRAHLGQSSSQSGIDDLLDWVYYHHTLSRFAMYHLRVKSTSEGSSPGTMSTSSDFEDAHMSPLGKVEPVCQTNASRSLCFLADDKIQVLRSSNPSHEILNLLSEICDVLLDPLDPRSRDEDYQAHLRSLQWNVMNLPASSASYADSDPIEKASELPLPVQMYQRATIVYLLRASQDPLRPSAKLDNIIDKSFAERITAPSCSHFFPLFILACEARTDEERTAILDLIERTEKGSPARDMRRFRAGIQSFWVQRDLHADSDLIMSYMDLMKVVVSSDHVPPYV